MKKVLVNNCMKYIKKYTNYNEIKLKEIEYGLVSIYLTFSKILIILVLAIVLKIQKEVIMFIICFNVLRTPGYGLHATKSWICLISSIVLFIGIPELCISLNINIYIKGIIGIIGTILMFKNAPADTCKRPIVNKNRRKILKIISTSLTLLFTIVSILIKNSFISNCLTFSILLENFLISPYIYKLFKLPYNNYITYIKTHHDLAQ